MRNGQVRFWWISEKSGYGQVTKKVLCDSVLDALWLKHCHSIIEVNDVSVVFNVGGAEFFDEMYLEPEYGTEDGFTTMYTDFGDEVDSFLTMFYDTLKEDEDWFTVDKSQIKEWLKSQSFKLESDDIKLY